MEKAKIEYVGMLDAIKRLDACDGFWVTGYYDDRGIEHFYSDSVRNLDVEIAICKRNHWSRFVAFVPSLLGYSDYDNKGLIGQVNNTVVWEEWNKEFGKTIDHRSVHEIGYGWNGSGIAIDPRYVAESQIELVESLESYPCLDDELLSQAEWEQHQETWESCYRSDFRHGIAKRLVGLTSDYADAFPESPLSQSDDWEEEEFISDLPDSQIDGIIDWSDMQWQIESDGSSYIDVDRLVADVDGSVIADLWSKFAVNYFNSLQTNNY